MRRQFIMDDIGINDGVSDQICFHRRTFSIENKMVRHRHSGENIPANKCSGNEQNVSDTSAPFMFSSGLNFCI